MSVAENQVETTGGGLARMDLDELSGEQRTAMELLLGRLVKSKSNGEFLASMSSPA